MCTCAAGQYQLTGACVACAGNHAKPLPGVEESDCVACLTVIGETSNAAHTACDTCVAGYYNKGKACVQCPNYPTPCADESSVLVSGYWRASAVAGDDGTEVLECRFGEESCPGTHGNGSGTTCIKAKWGYCACGYAGPTCAVCDSNDANSRFYMAWDWGKYESCDDGARAMLQPSGFSADSSYLCWSSRGWHSRSSRTSRLVALTSASFGFIGSARSSVRSSTLAGRLVQNLVNLCYGIAVSSLQHLGSCLLAGHLAVLIHYHEREQFVGRLGRVPVIHRDFRSRLWREQF